MAKIIDKDYIYAQQNPNFVKDLSSRQINDLCGVLREEIISGVSKNGGHLSSNLGAVEITVALYRAFNFPKDKLIFDVGHQCYAHKLLTGRKLDNLNQKGEVSGFICPEESIYDTYSAGHSSTSLSAAEAFAVARDLENDDFNVVALIGDGSVTSGLSLEALNNIGSRNNKVIVIINDNEMSISSPVGSIGKMFSSISSNKVYNDAKRKYLSDLVDIETDKHKQKSFLYKYYLKESIKHTIAPQTAFDEMGFTYIGPIDGHNVKALEKAFKRAQNTTKSTVVHVRTTKGKGYKHAETDKQGLWHSAGKFDIESGKMAKCKDIKWPELAGKLTYNTLQNNPSTYLVVPAMLIGSHMQECFDDFPNRTLDVGIAEEHAVTFSGALAKTGFHPICTIYSTFLQRAYDEIIHDCARIGSDVTLLIDRAGLAGKNGETHQGIYDVSFLRTIPGVTVTMPTNIEEFNYLYNKSLEFNSGVYAIRYPNEKVYYQTKEEKKLPISSYITLKEVKDHRPVIIGVGPMANDLYELVKDLDIGFIKALKLHPIDDELLDPIKNASSIFIYDAYSTFNGFAEELCSNLLLKEFMIPTKAFTCPYAYIQHMDLHQQKEECGLLPEQVYVKILQNLK